MNSVKCNDDMSAIVELAEKIEDKVWRSGCGSFSIITLIRNYRTYVFHLGRLCGTQKGSCRGSL